MRKPKLRELAEAIRSLFSPPYTSKFPHAPSVPFPNFRGSPEFHEKDCIGCKACAEVCPPKAIDVFDLTDKTPPMRRLELHYDRCIFCGHCELNCTTKKGVTLSQKYDTATFDLKDSFDAVEKELVLCEVCGVIVGARDHLLWTSRQVKAKQYANPTLVLVSQQALGLVGRPSPRAQDLPLERSDIMRILCPKCRRDVILRETWG